MAYVIDDQALLQALARAVKAHEAWTLKLTTAINLGACDSDPDDIACDDRCEFGQWLYGADITNETKAGKPYQVTRRLHAEFHACAARVARMAADDQKLDAYALLDGEYKQRSSRLLQALAKWRRELIET